MKWSRHRQAGINRPRRNGVQKPDAAPIETIAACARC